MGLASYKEREHEFKKQLIAEAAFQLFRNRSFESVTVQDIASAAECGKGTIYQFFINKDEVLYYIIANNLDRLIHNIELQCGLDIDFTTALVNYLSLQYLSHNNYGSLLMSLYRRHIEASVDIDSYYGELLLKRERKTQLVANLIKRGIQEGKIIEFDHYKLALIINNIIRSFCLGNLEIEPVDTDETADLEMIKGILVRGILTVNGGTTL